jgi:BirA family biotin operon repressor/biotin-[acetyl-CoA-carboxylase] ligase
MTRTAISPRFAIRIFWSTDDNVGEVTLGEHPPERSTVDLAPNWVVWHVPTVDSTNDRLASEVRADPSIRRTVLVADHQSAGRGRLGRRWEAPPAANLLCSLVLDAGDDPQRAQHMAALALLAAAKTLVGADLVLKWPNDVIVVDSGGSWRKVAGMLSARAVPATVIVGIGVNLAWAPDGGARVVGPAGEPPDRWELLRAMLTEIDQLESSGPDVVFARYRSALDTIGRRVRVELPGDGVVVGRAVDVEPSGELRIIDACALTHRIGVGDVVHLRDA